MSKLHRDEDGTLPSYAWPGGYQMIYICEDGGVLCPDCANGKNGSEASESPDAPKDWRMIAADIYYEGATLQCDHCNADIESAYGDPDAEETFVT